MILAGGTGKGLSVLTHHRAKTALPFGGKYRIIDFCLSNCVNSGLNDIFVLAQYNPKSLIEHIRMGKPWDLDRRSGGVTIQQPMYRGEDSDWYLGTADALLQNIDVIDGSGADLILVLSGDQVYLTDYSRMIDFHMKTGCPATIACKKVRISEHSRFGMLKLSERGNVTEFEEKPDRTGFDMASLGIYLFDRKELVRMLRKRPVDIVFDILMPLVEGGKVTGYALEDYWEDVGSIPSYYKASMRLLGHRNILARRDWPLFTRGEDLAGSRFHSGSNVSRSIVADGCSIRGKVRGSILFPGVRIDSGAVIEDSIVFSYSKVGRGSMVRKTIIDKHVRICRDVSIGYSGKRKGIAVIGKGARIASSTNVTAGDVIGTGPTDG
jgi:glucose-1-phosphate adenylyltransferase